MKVETVASGLIVPWELAFAPDGRIFVTERPGRLRVIKNGRLQPEPLAEIREVKHLGEGGLMGLALHPKFAQNRWLYLAYLYDNQGLNVRVVRYRETGSGLTDQKIIIDGIGGASVHDGCALKFGPDGKLYITTGDKAERGLAQMMNSLCGKILRVNDDGSVPRDNPFVNQPGARPEIWSTGHRNPQGLDWQPGTNTLFSVEHGPSGFDGAPGGDELNIVEKGKNYGWPIIHHRETKEGLVAPLLEYTPAVAPGGLAFYRGNKIPQWRNNLFFGCLRGARIVRVVLNGRRVVSQENLIEGEYGRIRAVASGTDGYLYFTTSNRDGRGRPASNDDRVLRFVP